MSRRAGTARWMRVLVLAAAAVGCDSGGGVARVGLEPAALDFGLVQAGGAATTRELAVRNEGGGRAKLWVATVEARESACGTFEIVGDPWMDLGGGESGAMEVVFHPRQDAAGGCGCVAIATLRLSFDADPFDLDVPLVARGACDRPLRCLPAEVDFPDALVGEARTATVTCWNLEPADVVVESAGLRPGDDGFTVGVPEPPLPATVAQGAAVAMAVSFRPPDAGEFSSSLEVQAGGRTIPVPLTATAERRFPRCSDGIPADADPVLETPAYIVTLETPDFSAYEGTIRSRWYYAEQPPLIADVLLATGGFADPKCSCGQKGHYAWWENCDHGPDDLFVNIHAFPTNPQVDAWVRRIAVWDRLQIRGWEVLKIDYPNGSWWQDAGCNTLMITWVCEL